MRYLTKDLAASFKHPEFWALSSWLDIVVRYRRSSLGLFWLVLPAVIYIWGLGGFFAHIAGTPLFRFAAHVAIGYAVFRVLSTVIVESTTAFASSSAFIMDGHVRLTDFVLRVIAKALFYFVASLPVVAIALAIYPDLLWTGVLLSVPSMTLIVFNVFWIGLVFGLVGARFPDMSQFIGNIFMFAFLLTPIIWRADGMPVDSLRGMLMRINPLFHMVEIVRAPMLGERIEMLTFYYMGVLTIVGWMAAVFAYRRYARFVPIWI
ncbi:ABC transporter permease [Pseudoxanthomonas wuyuanensis]